jgi:hypothetical protein
MKEDQALPVKGNAFGFGSAEGVFAGLGEGVVQLLLVGRVCDRLAVLCHRFAGDVARDPVPLVS